jgi:uncharacterized LabA/DUF88 family protein
MPHTDDRVMIFIDGSNFYNGAKSMGFATNVDFAKLVVKLAAGRKLVRAYYYNAPMLREDDPAPWEAQQEFFARLNELPYISVKLGRLELRGGSLVEKEVDITIAVDLVAFAYRNAYDTAILVTGDGDFSVAARAVQECGKNIENAYFEKGSAYHLRQSCDTFFLIDRPFWTSCLTASSRRRGRGGGTDPFGDEPERHGGRREPDDRREPPARRAPDERREPPARREPREGGERRSEPGRGPRGGGPPRAGGRDRYEEWFSPTSYPEEFTWEDESTDDAAGEGPVGRDAEPPIDDPDRVEEDSAEGSPKRRRRGRRGGARRRPGGSNAS